MSVMMAASPATSDNFLEVFERNRPRKIRLSEGERSGNSLVIAQGYCSAPAKARRRPHAERQLHEGE
jgi:hypothetical protein